MWKVCDELLEPYNVGRKYFPIFCQCQIMKWAGINYEGADTPRSNQKKHPRSKCFEVMNSSSMQRNRPLGWKSLFLIKFNVRHFFLYLMRNRIKLSNFRVSLKWGNTPRAQFEKGLVTLLKPCHTKASEDYRKVTKKTCLNWTEELN